MDLATYVSALRRDLLVAAAAGGDDARELAERLTAPLESAVQLMLLNVLSAAASEITREMAPGSVDMRLQAGEPSFVVSTPAGVAWEDEWAAPARPVAPPVPVGMSAGEDAAPARINFRPPEWLKTQIEEAAGGEGLSVNAWLVRAATSALAGSIDPEVGRGAWHDRAPQRGQRMTGWVR
ncbi:hypothetical protein [Pseudonocardia sp. HH130630-07]|uniref:hypothetical protein n=1 Tax=Pseudonocardia sp. HH130630-07 TaxID=1690815 RepID=UPI000815166A|nr:hypothetical protein [Pseudonocardia sp. HH130630-07]ANY05792.1 hypothetical protein AFB00_05175 [Pseudonocardia sp. HH130630-07]